MIKAEDWIDITVTPPTEAGEYLTYSAKSAYKYRTAIWLPEVQCWEHEWLQKKRSEFKPKTWVTHYMPVTPPN